jgi:hypothetical protein
MYDTCNFMRNGVVILSGKNKSGRNRVVINRVKKRKNCAIVLHRHLSNLNHIVRW